jgi:Ca-activated chloride channel homolog
VTSRQRLIGSLLFGLILMGLASLFANVANPSFALGFRGPTYAEPWLAWLVLTLALALMVREILVRRALAPKVLMPALFLIARVRPRLTWRQVVLGVLPGARAAAIVLLGLALARPQTTEVNEANDEEGIDIMVALDLSESMEAVLESGFTRAHDKKPTRLDTAKGVLVDFVAKRPHDRIGVVVFGREAYLLAPPTLDHALLSAQISKMELRLVDGQGTAIGDALGTAIARLRKSEGASKVIVLLTDGDNNAGSIAPEYAAELAERQQIAIHTVQIGSTDDAEVFAGHDLFGDPVYQRAKYPINPALLQAISRRTGGESFVASDGLALAQSMKQILDRLEKSKAETVTTRPIELFVWLLIPAVLVLILWKLLHVLAVTQRTTSRSTSQSRSADRLKSTAPQAGARA